ncbi:hypothetical protein [Fundicoccus culcitae]|uniref:PepSY domain-containing protein n=1 Tax=Fundicoccus culcitae TaxID=2969821 RepID=A0ABY5P654_9LACT|nr:hypothetical protein [Fundicoccus culcitae]UUX34159.1 hypothetical protein NRE15_00365 [Fundicoccus culcitae]
MNTQKKENLIGSLLLITGLIVGAASVILIKENKPKHAGKVLEQILHDFRENNTVVGSWIDYDPIPFEEYQSKPLVYIGEVSTQEDNKVTTYRFASDIYTGEIIDLVQI